ncbi:RNA polymerase sigma factor, partial [Calditrichota bacterium]
EGLPFEEKEVVRLALSKVPLVQREALVMYEILGMTVNEVASQQKVSQSAVKSRLSRGRARLAREYEKLAYEEIKGEEPIIREA